MAPRRAPASPARRAAAFAASAPTAGTAPVSSPSIAIAAEPFQRPFAVRGTAAESRLELDGSERKALDRMPHAVALPSFHPTSPDGGAVAEPPVAYAAEATAGEEPDQASPNGELGHSGARISIGEGEDRVSLLIAVRGDAVRVEARAHSAAYAEAFNQRSGELASGLADHGLSLGSLTTDVAGEGPAQSQPERQDERSGRREPDPRRSPEPDGTPTPQRPRGLRAIA